MEDLFKRGEELFSMGRCEEARQFFLSIIETAPYNKEPLNNLGVIAYQEGNDKAATDYFLKALSLDPYYRDAILNLAHTLRATNRLAAILPLVKKQVRYNPRDNEIREILDEVNLLSHPDERDANLRSQEAGEAFFVLSAGNCGTLTLAELLRTANNARVFSRPDAKLECDLLACYWGEADRRKVLLEARHEMIQGAWKDGFIYGETTPSITHFWDILAQEFPRSKFIVLVRDPLQYARSGLFQNFYQGHPADSNRPKPSPEGRDYGVWKKSSQIEKVCWLWQETYGFLDQETRLLERDRLMIVHFEELISNTQKVEAIFDFLNLNGFQKTVISAIQQTKHNARHYGRFPDTEDWSPRLRETVRRICGPVAQAYGYSIEERKDRSVHAGEEISSDHVSVRRHSNQPMVSIGLPLYSGGTMLAEAIESILSQDYGDFELLISDHGSDPFVNDIGHYYQKLDKRVKYVDSGDQINYIGIHNFARMIELSTAPYFMWGSYDDRLEQSFISRCLATIERDESIALVYPRSKVYDNKNALLGFGPDSVKADSDDPADRFVHVIWELQMCNAFHGLFRRCYMRRTHALRKNCYAHDTLFLAEIALLGKIIQIDDVLFIRHLTRNYNVSLDAHHADMIRSLDPVYLEEGLTLPFCRLTYAHCELVNHSTLPPERKEYLTREIVRCFRQRWAVQLNYEINRLIELLKHDVYYQTWDGRNYQGDVREQAPNLFYFHLTDLMKSIREALFIFPEHQELHKIYEASIGNIKIPERRTAMETQVNQEVTQ